MDSCVLGRLVEQKSHPLTHERSSVGARSSSAAPVEQRSVTAKILSWGALKSPGLLFDGGGRGRPRPDRRAFVC